MRVFGDDSGDERPFLYILVEFFSDVIINLLRLITNQIYWFTLREVIDVVLHPAFKVIVGLKKLTLSSPGTSIDGTGHFQLVDYLNRDEIVPNIIDIYWYSAKRACRDMFWIFMRLEHFLETCLTKRMSKYQIKYPQNSLLGLWKTS